MLVFFSQGFYENKCSPYLFCVFLTSLKESDLIDRKHIVVTFFFFIEYLPMQTKVFTSAFPSSSSRICVIQQNLKFCLKWPMLITEKLPSRNMLTILAQAAKKPSKFGLTGQRNYRKFLFFSPIRYSFSNLSITTYTSYSITCFVLTFLLMIIVYIVSPDIEVEFLWV